MGASNEFSRYSSLRFTKKTSSSETGIFSLIFHVFGAVAALPENPFTFMFSDPGRMKPYFIAGQPNSMMAGIGKVVGAAAWVCPNGHTYFIGNCTRAEINELKKCRKLSLIGTKVIRFLTHAALMMNHASFMTDHVGYKESKIRAANLAAMELRR